MVGGPECDAARGDAIVALSAIVGTPTLAPVAAGGALSLQILECARDHLLR
jgi:hypothetical protein